MRKLNRTAAWSFAFGVALAGILVLVTLGIVAASRGASDRLLHGAALDRAVRAVSAPGEAGLDGRGHRILDEEGRVLAQVGAPAGPTPGAAAIREALRAGEPRVAVVALPGGRTVAEVLLPHALDGRPAAALVAVDVTAERARLEATLWSLAALVAALASLGFWVPLLAFLLRSRQKDRVEARAAYLADHEPMTGLLGRPRFMAALEAAVEEHRASGAGLAVLCIDLDGLREVNDSLGHDVGDAAIVRVARSLVTVAGPGALVARLGGDEFAVALPRAGSPAEVGRLAALLIETIAAPLEAAGQTVAVSARIGIAAMPGDGDTGLRLLKGADLALDRARSEKPGSFVFFESTIENELQRRRDLEAQLRETLANDAFDLHFQPLFETLHGGLVGFEALLRMPAGAQGFVSPALFIPIAEEIGLITPIGDWVVRRACAVARQWPDHLSVAVNLSPAQFKEGGVHRTVREALKETGLDPRRLQLEITEGLLLNDDAEIMQELAELKALGVSIVMDDFGTGYSSLSYLWKFPFDKIKIDRSFMRAFEADDRNVANILQAIMSLSRALKMRVTAEGVETEAQAQFLRNLGCDEVQGYYFGRPTPLVDVAALVMRDGQRRMGLDAAPAEGGSIRLISG